MAKQKLEARELYFSCNGKVIVQNVNMVVSQGEIRGVLGPNGAGKSTTFLTSVLNGDLEMLKAYK